MTFQRTAFRLIIAIIEYCSANNETASTTYKLTKPSNNLSKYTTAASEYKAKSECYNKIATISKSGTSSPTILAQMQQKIDECESIHITSIAAYNPWQGTQISAGGGSTTGNGSSTNAQANAVINYKPMEADAGWNFNTLGQYDYLSSDISNGIEKNRLYLQQNGYYMFNKYNGMFAQVSYLNDTNSGYIYLWNENIGYQLQLFKTSRQNLLLSIGPGMQEVQSTSSQTITQPTWLTQITYSLNLNNHLSFNEQLQNVATPNNVTTYSISELTIQIHKNFGIGLNYQFTYNSLPEPTKATLTTISGVTLVYSLD